MSISATRPIEMIVRGALIHAGNLLVCRNRKQGHTFLPGGHIELGEPARLALEREIKEELGIVMHATRFLGACESSFLERRKHKEDFVHEVNLIFTLEMPFDVASSPQAFVSQEDKIEFLWLDLDHLHQTGRLLPPSILSLLRGATEFTLGFVSNMLPGGE